MPKQFFVEIHHGNVSPFQVTSHNSQTRFGIVCNRSMIANIENGISRKSVYIVDYIKDGNKLTNSFRNSLKVNSIWLDN